jgi:hypothetical protein
MPRTVPYSQIIANQQHVDKLDLPAAAKRPVSIQSTVRF